MVSSLIPDCGGSRLQRSDQKCETRIARAVSTCGLVSSSLVREVDSASDSFAIPDDAFAARDRQIACGTHAQVSSACVSALADRSRGVMARVSVTALSDEERTRPAPGERRDRSAAKTEGVELTPSGGAVVLGEMKESLPLLCEQGLQF